ncbi:MAG: lipid IV(A) 3-deoxy-D-manno-octulosonic acid transferase [Nevskiales bacterium]|nr:lipid IV(A) 3-deoxy-D-manno-octulosonic acid transferase [Nevskiales bacterium]
MRLLYSTLLYLLAPWILLRLFWRGWRQREYWQRIPERFGHVVAPPGGVAAWVHAVSVGESLAALPLIRRLVATHPPRSILVTTTTPTGSARVRAALGDTVLHTYVPYDLPHAVARFVRRMRPRRVIVMETELWPNLFRTLAKRGVPLVIANARLSPKSFAGYSKLGGFVRTTLADCSVIAAQSPADARRFRQLGAHPDRVHVMGNLKFDFEVPAGQVVRGRELRQTLGVGRPVWIAASTHEGEEALALDAHQHVLKHCPLALLILVPRHPQRFDAVAKLIERSGLSFIRRSELNGPSPVPRLPSPVFLGDSMGELPMYLAAADVAFVGGSLVAVGGHNVLEPAALGLPVLFGPHMFNFEEARTQLLERGAARQIAQAGDLGPAMTALLRDAAQRTTMGHAGQGVVNDNRGALGRLFVLLEAI